MAIKTRRFFSNTKNCSCCMPGVWRAMQYCEGAVIVFHSPKACAHVARTMDINAFYGTLAAGKKETRQTIPLLSSQLEETHAIFGGIERLRQCIDFALSKFKPECLVVANSCVAGVIGDDVASLVSEIESEYGLPVLTVDCCGFLDGEYYQGYYEITQQLVDRFLKACPTVADTVLLLGDNGGPWGDYAQEVTRLLNAMKLKVIGQFPTYMAFKDIPIAASAETIIVLGGLGQTGEGFIPIAKKMAAKFNMKYLAGVYPVGWAQTEEWIVKTGELTGRKELAQKVLDAERLRLWQKAESLHKVTANKKTVLSIGRYLSYFDPSAVFATIKRLKLDLKGVILLDAYDANEREKMRRAVERCCDAPIYSTAEGEPLLKASELLLTTHPLQGVGIKQLFLPMTPLVGTKGELDFMEGIYRCLCSRLKGGLYYV